MIQKINLQVFFLTSYIHSCKEQLAYDLFEDDGKWHLDTFCKNPNSASIIWPDLSKLAMNALPPFSMLLPIRTKPEMQTAMRICL